MFRFQGIGLGLEVLGCVRIVVGFGVKDPGSFASVTASARSDGPARSKRASQHRVGCRTSIE